MSINYDEILTKDQKIQILNNRISQLILEGYQNSVGMKVAQKLGNEDRIMQIQEILDIIETSLMVHKQELDSFSEEKSE